jgi:hypothetical protein
MGYWGFIGFNRTRTFKEANLIFLGFMRRNTDVFGAATGILQGFWEIRDVLLPSFVTWLTMVDRVIVRCSAIYGWSLFWSAAFHGIEFTG